MNNITRYLTGAKSFSYWFLYPLIELPLSVFNNRNGNMLVNVFIGDELIPDIEDNRLFIVYKVILNEDFIKLEAGLRIHPCYEANYDLDNNGTYRVAVMKIPSCYEQDFKNFIEGKYSKFSPKAKSIIKTLYGDDSGTKVIVYSLDKSPKLKAKREELLGVKLNDSDELWSKYSYEQEYITKALRDDLNTKSLVENTTFDE